jgi:hypothetical protein
MPWWLLAPQVEEVVLMIPPRVFPASSDQLLSKFGVFWEEVHCVRSKQMGKSTFLAVCVGGVVQPLWRQ